MSPPPLQHSTIVLGRTYAVPPAAVFAALTVPQERIDVGQACEPVVIVPEHTDFRVGGTELIRFGMRPRARFHVRSVYQDIVPDSRIVTSEAVYEAEARISIGLTALELLPHPCGTRLKLTAQLLAMATDDVLEQAAVRYPALLEGLARHFGVASRRHSGPR